MPKTNIRSIRFSDEVAEAIESMAGETFTAKFEMLIFKCVLELPQKEQELASINRRIEEQKKKLAKLQSNTAQLMKSFDYTRTCLDKYQAQVLREIDELQKL